MTDLLPPPPLGDETAAPARAAAAPRPVTGADVASTGLAVAVAVGLGALVRFGFGWHNPLALLVIAYGGFLAVTAARSGELRRLRDGDPGDVDLDLTRRDLGGAGGGATTIDDAFTRPLLRAPEPARSAPTGPAAIPGVLDDDPDNDVPRSVRILGERDAWEAGAAVLAGLAMALVLRTLLGWGGLMSTVVWAYLAFVVVYFALVWDSNGQEIASDRVITVAVWTAGALTLSGLLWMLGLLVVKGLPQLRPTFFTQDMSTVGPNDPGGGALHAIIGTVEQVGIAVIVVVPIAILTAVYLHELQGRLAKPIRFVVDAMSGLPSIVAGLLVFTVWVNGRGFSGMAGSAALVILMLPTVTRTSEEILRTIPDSLREASLALGAPQWRVVWRVVVPTALPGLVTAVILGIARAIGETAPMILTAFGSDSIVLNPTAGPQSDLPLFVWKLILLPNEIQKERAWTGALVLVLLVLALFIVARVIASRARKRLGRAR